MDEDKSFLRHEQYTLLEDSLVPVSEVEHEGADRYMRHGPTNCS